MTTSGNLSTPAGLSSDQVAFYQEHGWLVSERVLDETLLDGAERGLHQHWAGHRDRIISGAKQHFADWMPGDGDGITRNNEYLSLQNRAVSELAWSPVIGAIAGAAAQSSEIRLFDDQMVYKPGGQAEAVVGWHVDGDYWGTCSSQEMLTAWIPLHDCPEELGPLVVLDGSHRWSHQLDRSALSFHRKDMEGLARVVEALGYEFKPVVLEMKRGQFSLHHCRTIHGSYPNRGSRPRIALAVHMQDGANTYHPAKRADGRPIQLCNDLLCCKNPAGDPDYHDESIFPILWPVMRRAETAEGGLWDS